MMIKKKWYKRTARLVSIGLFFQLITTQKVEGIAIPLAIALPQVSAYVTGVAGVLAAHKYMPDMSTSMDEVARTMHDKLDNRWCSSTTPYAPHNPMSPAYQKEVHVRTSANN